MNDSQSAAAVASATKRTALNKLALKGSSYELLTMVLQQALRLGGNLILTRLLFPEAFGLSALVALFNHGLAQLSDVGIAPGVIQSKKGDDPDFLNTAFTLQVIRGSVLFVVGVAIAWPVAAIYEEPLLGPLLAAGSTAAFIHGLSSTSMLTLRRHVDRRRIMIISLTSQVVSLAVMIPFAWYYRSVWALVIGSLAGALTETIQSHLIRVGYRNHFSISKDASRAIIKFGRWIFWATAMNFVANQADRMLLGKLLGVGELGVYTVALTFAELGNMITMRLTQEVFFPILSRAHREDPGHLRSIYYRVRLALDAALLPAAGVGCVIAPWVISVLYDDRYADAGWMMRILIVRLMFQLVTVSSQTCLFAIGETRYAFYKGAMKMVWMVAAIPLGFHFYGLPGIVWAAAFADAPALLVLLPPLARRGILRLRREILVPLFFASGAAIAYLIQSAFSGV
jgi:O-antigen/teichoic acid export membrane protein